MLARAVLLATTELEHTNAEDRNGQKDASGHNDWNVHETAPYRLCRLGADFPACSTALLLL